jgi:hypothetical protein
MPTNRRETPMTTESERELRERLAALQTAPLGPIISGQFEITAYTVGSPMPLLSKEQLDAILPIITASINARVRESDERWIRQLGCPDNRARDEALQRVAVTAALEHAATCVWQGWNVPIGELNAAWAIGEIEQRIRAIIPPGAGAASPVDAEPGPDVPAEHRIARLERELDRMRVKFLTSFDNSELKEQLASERQKYDELLAKCKRWEKAIVGLTPGGSEFVGDPEYCAAYIRKRTEYPRMIIELRKERDELAAHAEAMVHDLERNQHIVGTFESAAAYRAWQSAQRQKGSGG